MLNYIRADLYRIFSRPFSWLVCLIISILPALAVLGVGENYSTEQVMLGVQVGIYILFIFLSLLLNEYTFREDMQLGMMKNDTTSGVSRGRLFTSKYLTGVLIEVVLWGFCSTCAVLASGYIFGMDHMVSYIGGIFSLQAVSWILTNLLLLALFQVISIYVKKTSGLILVCLIISAFISNFENLLAQAVPGAESAFLLVPGYSGAQAASALAVPFIGIVILLAVGCFLFQRSEF